MPSLEHHQLAMMRALDLGPAFFPDDLFEGDRERALLGMKVHANTISHARLVALEETYPRTRAMIGREKFNRLSRQFLDCPSVTASPLATIGESFSAFLQALGKAHAVSDLAAFEWHWLQAYHAAEAPVMKLAGLAGLGEDAVLEVVLARHPAAHVLHLGRKVHRLIGRDMPGLASAAAILLSRPQAQVLVSPVTAVMVAIVARLDEPVSICNLLEDGTELEGGDRASPQHTMIALVTLMEAGALQEVER